MPVRIDIINKNVRRRRRTRFFFFWRTFDNNVRSAVGGSVKMLSYNETADNVRLEKYARKPLNYAERIVVRKND